MGKWEKKKNRMEKADLVKKVVLLFVSGFFVGAVFYYLFQNTFEQLIEYMEGQLIYQENIERSILSRFVQAVWNHGRFFALFWLLSVTVLHRIYRSVFLLYNGFQNGFLTVFFIFMRGIKGLLLYPVSLFPHTILFVPLYLYSFLRAEKKYGGHRVLSVVLMILLFFLACFLEAKYNFLLMRQLL